MNLSDSVNSVGLVFDILGVLILFKYGLPSKIKTPPTLLVQSNLGDKEILENKKIKKWAYRGLILLIIGFITQLLSSYVGLIIQILINFIDK